MNIGGWSPRELVGAPFLASFARSGAFDVSSPGAFDKRNRANPVKDNSVKNNLSSRAKAMDLAFSYLRLACAAVRQERSVKGSPLIPTLTPRTPHSGNRPRWCCPRQKKRPPCVSMPTCCAGSAASPANKPASTLSCAPTCRRMSRKASSPFEVAPESQSSETLGAAPPRREEPRVSSPAQFCVFSWLGLVLSCDLPH
jgi:hypothetical protein